MNKAEKTAMIEELKEKFANADFFYVTDSSTLSAEKTTELRSMMFAKGIEMKVVKNTLVKKALEDAPAEKGYAKVLESLKGPTALLFSDVAKAPAQVIKEFRKTSDRPVLKAAYIETDVFVGDEQIDALTKLKSKEDLLADVIALLQSPIKNVLGSLQSGGQTISGLLKALEERGEAA